ncbi:MAG: hypothetical protein JNK33_04305 [Candidatus Doudnabacteria bacterium]|nr:hypothetical protein [Candidatus Doudnabacteria bacterium]
MKQTVLYNTILAFVYGAILSVGIIGVNAAEKPSEWTWIWLGFPICGFIAGLLVDMGDWKQILKQVAVGILVYSPLAILFGGLAYALFDHSLQVGSSPEASITGTIVRFVQLLLFIAPLNALGVGLGIAVKNSISQIAQFIRNRQS